jgi:hypothetical protein
MALELHVIRDVFTLAALEWFLSLSMVVLAVQKLQDIRTFRPCSSTTIAGDAMGALPTIYPFAELLAGVLMTAQHCRRVGAVALLMARCAVSVYQRFI